MRTLIVIASVAVLAGCSLADQGQPKVSWSYGAGNGDGVTYPGPAPTFSRAYGYGADQVGTPGEAPRVNYAYGAEGQTGGMVQTSRPDPVQAAAPAATTTTAGRPAVSSPHS